MRQRIDINEAAALLQSFDNVLILTHSFPDGDTLGSAHALNLALISMGKKSGVSCEGEIPKKFECMWIGCPEFDFKPDYIIAVDVADLNLIGNNLSKTYKDKINLCIDHHSTNKLFADYTLLDKSAAAAGEIIFRLLKLLEVKITPKIAECLYTSISTDTGCFRFSNTTPKTLRAAAELIEYGADAVEVNRQMFESRSKQRLALERAALKSLEYYFNDECAIISLTESMISETGASENDMDGITAIPITIEGVKCGVTLRQIGEEFKVSVRSTNDINAAKLCEAFGGGGHKNAAGCTMKYPLEVTKELLLAEIEKSLIKK